MERDVLSSILEYLQWAKVFHYRQNTGAVKTEHGRFIRFGVLGSPDIICVINGQYVGIEVKDKAKQSPHQIDFQQRLEKAGGRYILAHGVEDVVAALK